MDKLIDEPINTINTDEFNITITYTKPYKGQNIEMKKVGSKFIALPEQIKNSCNLPYVNADLVYRHTLEEGLTECAQKAINLLICDIFGDRFDENFYKNLELLHQDKENIINV